MMDPQAFVRLSIGSLGLRIPVEASKLVQSVNRASSSPCCCEIRLQGFPVQRAPIPLISSAEANPDPHSKTTVFYLEKSNVKALIAKRCFQTPQVFLEIVVYLGRQKQSLCSISSKKQQLGTFRMEVGPEWEEGKPALIHNGWIRIGKHKQGAGRQGPELHLRVKLDPDPRYVFQFEDETTLGPQIVQIQGSIKQPIFSCKFSRDRRAAQDQVGNYWPSSNSSDKDHERRERKGWKVVIHDLSGSAAAAAFMATPFVPSSGCDWVSRSNPGSWLIVRPDPVATSESWHPWGRLEAWRETGPRDSVCLRLYLLPEYQDTGVLVSEIMLNADKGGEFFIDMDRQTPVGTPVVSPKGSSSSEYGVTAAASIGGGQAAMVAGFVMNCRVQGEGKISKPVVQLAMRHVTCVEDAAIFMALAAAVDLSIEACRPFRRKTKKGNRHSLVS
ncbi:uncharacterized protein M6B38_279940 [Iris pallida]|uniref:Uncharacterized protein n=1 Tax=Iris pallida TaxID=29817 RepID=A0AAX6G1K4_IRIPA|nr:uncharacterized protein M6B38_390545 [Iris pallida]KAJ6845928.1 uncharacterized protein M6B38_279940 [Iris pallida]